MFLFKPFGADASFISETRYTGLVQGETYSIQVEDENGCVSARQDVQISSFTGIFFIVNKITVAYY